MAGDHADSSATASRVPARAGSIVPPKSGFPGPDDAPLNAAVAGGADIDEGDLRPVQQRRRLRRESLPVHHSAGAVTDAVIASIPLITSPGLDRRMRHVRPPPRIRRGRTRRREGWDRPRHGASAPEAPGLPGSASRRRRAGNPGNGGRDCRHPRPPYAPPAGRGCGAGAGNPCRACALPAGAGAWRATR